MRATGFTLLRQDSPPILWCCVLSTAPEQPDPVSCTPTPGRQAGPLCHVSSVGACCVHKAVSCWWPSNVSA